MALTVGLILFMMFLALSRVYLGEHSYNQVLFGSSLGITLAFIMHFKVKPIVKRLPVYLKLSSPTISIGLISVLTLVVPIIVATTVYHIQLAKGITYDKSQDVR